MNLKQPNYEPSRTATTIFFIILIWLLATSCTKEVLHCGNIAQAYWSHELGEVSSCNAAGCTYDQPYVVIQFEGEANARNPLLNGVKEYDITKYEPGQYYCLE